MQRKSHCHYSGRFMTALAVWGVGYETMAPLSAKSAGFLLNDTSFLVRPFNFPASVPSRFNPQNRTCVGLTKGLPLDQSIVVVSPRTQATQLTHIPLPTNPGLGRKNSIIYNTKQNNFQTKRSPHSLPSPPLSSPLISPRATGRFWHGYSRRRSGHRGVEFHGVVLHYRRHCRLREGNRNRLA